VQRISFTNARGTVISFDNFPPYYLWKIDRTGLPEVTTIKTQTVGQSGYTFHGNLFESREVKVTGHVFGRAGLEAFYGFRRRLNDVLNPLLGPGELVYQNSYGVWKIPAFANAAPYEDRIGPSQTLNIIFECPSPFWRSMEASIASLAYIYGGLRFPVRLPNRFGAFGYQAFIDNGSDVETPIEMTIDGGSSNPIIINETTGDFIKLAKHVNVGEQLFINTDTENLEVSLIYVDPATNGRVRENAYGYLTNDSRLFRLARGLNRLRFMSDDENRNVRITIRFYKLYVGV